MKTVQNFTCDGNAIFKNYCVAYKHKKFLCKARLALAMQFLENCTKIKNSECSRNTSVGKFCLHTVWPGCIFSLDSNAIISENYMAMASENCHCSRSFTLTVDSENPFCEFEHIQKQILLAKFHEIPKLPGVRILQWVWLDDISLARIILRMSPIWETTGERYADVIWYRTNPNDF